MDRKARESGSAPAKRGRCFRRAAVLAVLVLLPFSGIGQTPPARPADRAPAGLDVLPLRQWLEAGDREEIPWRVSVSPPRLGYHQRQVTFVRTTILGSRLQKTSVQRHVYLVVLAADATGRWLPGEGSRAFKLTETLGKSTDLEFTVPAFVQPGNYTLAVFLYDRVTGERCLTRRPLKVPPIPDDPWRDAGHRLPAVQFLPAVEGADASYLPMVAAKLDLPVPTKRPVQVEILANFTGSEQYSGSRIVQSINFSILLPTLKLLAGMNLPNGSLTITALDLDRQRVFFQQQNVRSLDWKRLGESLTTLNPATVDVRELQTQRQRATFFREVVERRITSAVRGRPLVSRPSDDDPLRIFIVLGHGIQFPRGSDLKPVAPVEDCNCRIYYVQYQIGVYLWRLDRFGRVGYDWDELHKILKPLSPKRYEVEDPNTLRRALAAILAEMRKN